MGFLDKVKKKLVRPHTDEFTPGGSGIYRYENMEETGFRPPKAYGQYAEEITAHFEAMFPGRKTTVFHEILSDLVHIDVNIMYPSEKGQFYVMYTTGMSDLPMTLPEGYEDRKDLQFAELFLFLPPDWKPGTEGELDVNMDERDYWPIRLIKFLARFPHEYSTWLGGGHTMPNGPDYEPFCAGTEMGGVVLTQFGEDLGGFTAEDGTPVNLLMVIPAYREEIEYKLKYGMSALDEVFSENNLPMVLDISRPNYCKDFKERLD